MHNKPRWKFRELVVEYGRLFYSFWASTLGFMGKDGLKDEPTLEKVKEDFGEESKTTDVGHDAKTAGMLKNEEIEYTVNALLEKAKKGDTKGVKLLITAGMNINVRDNKVMDKDEVKSVKDKKMLKKEEDAEKGLKTVGADNHIKAGEMLKNERIDCTVDAILAKVKEVRDFLEKARKGDTGAVKLLITAGININAQNNEGNTALYYASMYNHIETVQALLAHGAKVEEKDNQGKTALIVASMGGYTNIIQALLAHGAKVEEKDNRGGTAFTEASLQGHAKAVQILLAHGARIGSTALIEASIQGHVKAVQDLLAYGADIEEKGDSGITALMMASLNGEMETIQALLAHRAEVDVKNDNGWTALHYASKCGHMDIIQALLAHGANIEAKDKYGYTAFMKASLSGQTETAQALLAHGADIEAKAHHRVTALIQASLNGQTETVRGLLAHGADIEAKDSLGRTAFFWALEMGRVDTVQALLAHGADTEAKDGSGRTAFFSAERSGVDTVRALAHRVNQTGNAKPVSRPIPRPIQGETGTGKTVLSDAYNAFGFHLFHPLAEKINQNIFVSPTSIALALSMVYNGANGETKKEIAQTLQLQNMSIEEINERCAYLMEMLNVIDIKVKCCIANSLWMKHADQILTEFKDCVQKYFDAELGNLEGAPDTINAWVSRQTQGKIQKIVGPEVIKEDIMAVLVNAIYFRGKWTKPFKQNNTYDAMFTLLRGDKKSCRMMVQGGDYLYLENLQFQAIRLPYGKEYIGMFIFLPQQNVMYSDFLSLLTIENWTIWRGQFQKQKGSIGLPRFRCEYTTDLNATLSRIGMPSAFDREKADFSGIAPLFFISTVRHKTFLEVNEEGTEAAAVTAIELEFTCGIIDRSRPFKMIVDRPFFCAIVDERTDSILFMGAIIEP